MGKTLKQIQEKYPRANYPPDPNCKKCKGDGEWFDGRFKNNMRPCICIFVDHDHAPQMARMLRGLATKELAKMNRAD